MKLRSVIFDMDGVICDSEKLHMQAFQRVLREEGVILTDNDYFDKYLAFDDRGCFTAIIGSIDSEKMKSLLARKAKYFDEQMLEGLVIFPGAASFVTKCAEKYSLALASGARRLEVEYVLKKAKLRGLFGAIISADDVQKGKPDPESFLRALSLLNEVRLHGSDPIQPANCLVIEDSKHGLNAAKNAGMKCVAITTSYKADQLTNADLIVDSLVGLEVAKLEGLFG